MKSGLYFYSAGLTFNTDNIMNNPTINIIADWRYGVKPENSRNYEDIPQNEVCYNNWWYLHGELERIVHFDKGDITNADELGLTTKIIPWTHISGNQVLEIAKDIKEYTQSNLEGIYPVTVEGINQPCVGYFWTADHKTVYYKDKAYQYYTQRGLVCLVSDKDGCEYAERLMKEKPRIY